MKGMLINNLAHFPFQFVHSLARDVLGYNVASICIVEFSCILSFRLNFRIFSD